MLISAFAVLAYMDPTAGGFLLQLVLGGGALVTVVIKLAKTVLRRVARRADSDPAVPD